MSENLDLVRSIYADWERGDFHRTDWADPGIEMTQPDALEGGVLRGLASTSEGWRGWLQSWDDYRAQAHEYRVLDQERVLVAGRMTGRGKLSGATGETDIVNVFHIRDGKVIKLVMYHNRDRALADLGLKD
jgi:ketosteroid isomerase-like protein